MTEMMIVEMAVMNPVVPQIHQEAHVATMNGNVEVETNASPNHFSVMAKMTAKITVMKQDVVST